MPRSRRLRLHRRCRSASAEGTRSRTPTLHWCGGGLRLTISGRSLSMASYVRMRKSVDERLVGMIAATLGSGLRLNPRRRKRCANPNRFSASYICTGSSRSRADDEDLHESLRALCTNQRSDSCTGGARHRKRDIRPALNRLDLLRAPIDIARFVRSEQTLCERIGLLALVDNCFRFARYPGTTRLASDR
jgi:hypothetical protein